MKKRDFDLGLKPEDFVQPVFDEYYKDIEIYQVVKKVGPSERDYIIDIEVVESKRNIDEFIESQKDSCGLNYYLDQYVRAGEPVPVGVYDSTVSDVDMTNAPESADDMLHIIEDAKKSYDDLPSDLKAGKSAEDFLASFTLKDFKEYLEAKAIKEGKKEAPTNE